MRRVAERLRNKLAHSGERWVLVKGGPLPGNETIDLLHDGDRMIELPGHRIETVNTHGTGCTLSAALAALRAELEPLGHAFPLQRHVRVRRGGPAGTVPVAGP
ncbi:hypothetical protein G6F40_017275 [Rhizopus arrhizus]|nr:hypothetical protein G6F40_017275 [Rhizopus arrhizus]